MDLIPLVSEESVQRYVTHASDRCVQDLLSASRPELCDDWKLYKIKRGVEICRRYQGPVMVVRGRSFINVPPGELKSLANAIETAKVGGCRAESAMKFAFPGHDCCRIICCEIYIFGFLEIAMVDAFTAGKLLVLLLCCAFRF